MELITINNLIIAVTSLVSILAFTNQELSYKLSHYPVAEHGQNEWYRMLTGGFVHADPFHLFINMFVLYQFGGTVENEFKENFGELGKLLYLLFYMTTVIFANLPTYAKNKNNSRYMAVGASGATSAVVFAFILYHPLAMLGLFMVIPIPAVLFGILYLWYSTYASNKAQDNIDHDAHFYGAVFGFVFAWMLEPSQIRDFIYQILNVFN